MRCAAAGQKLRLMLERIKEKLRVIASNLATLYTQRDIINRKIFLEDSRLMNVLMCSD